MNEAMKTLCRVLITVGILSSVSHASAAPLPAAAQVEFQTHYQKGEALYLAKQYAEAIASFQKALAIQSDPNVLYNIAQCHRKLDHHREAKEYFEWFLRIPNDISVAERQNITDIIAELNEKIRKADAAKVIVVRAEQPVRPAWRIGVGIVGIAAGAALIGYGGIVASVDGQAVLQGGKEDFTRVYDTKTKGIALIVPGAAFLIGGVVLLALPGERKKTSDGKGVARAIQNVSVGAVGSGTGLVVQGRF